MDNLNIALQNLRNFPGFEQLTYDEQLQVRSAVLLQELQKVPEFLELSPDDKQMAFAHLSLDAPKLQDRVMSDFVQQIGQKAQEGDQEALRIASNFLIRRSVTTKSVIANVIDNQLVAPLLDRGLESIQDLKGATNTLMTLSGQEEGKVAEYFSYLVSEDKQVAKRTKSLSLLAGGLAQFAELGLIWGLGIGFTPATAKLAGKLFVWPFQKAMAAAKSSQMIGLTSLAMNVSHGVAGGMFGTAQRLTLDALEGTLQTQEWQETVANTKQYFGEFFIADIISNIAFGVVVPMLKGIGKNFKGWGNYQMVLNNLPKTEADELIKRIALFQDVSPQQLRALDAFSPGILQNAKSLQRGLKVLNQLGSGDVGSMGDDFLHLILTAHGYGLEAVGGGFKVWNMADTGKVLEFPSAKSVQDWVVGDMVKMRNRVAVGVLDSGAKGAGYDYMSIRKVVKKNLPLTSPRNVDLLTGVLAPQNGRFTAKGLEDFTRGYLGSMDAGQPILRGIKVDTISEGGNAFLKLSVGAKEIGRVKSGFVSPGEEMKAITQLLGNLNDIAKTFDLKGAKRITSEVYSRNLSKQYLYTPAWLDYIARNQLNGSVTRGKGMYKFVGQDGKGVFFDSLDDLGDFILSKTTSVDDLAFHLAKNEGLLLRSLEDGTFSLTDPAKREIWKGDSIEALLRENREFLPKPSEMYGPKVALINPRAIELTYVDQAVVGSYHEILKHLDNFSRKPGLDKVKLGSAGMNISVGRSGGKAVFEAHIPDLGWRGNFANIDDAKAFIKQAKESYMTLKDIAAGKGYRMTMFDGDYFLYSDNGVAIRAATRGEVESALAKAPIPEWAPEISGLPSDIIQPFDIPWQIFPEDASLARTVRFLPNFRRTLSDLTAYVKPLENVFDTAIYHGGNPVFKELVNGIEHGRRMVSGRQQQVARAVFTAAAPNGKVLPHDELVKIGKLLEVPMDTWGNYAARHGLTEIHTDVAKRLKSLWGESAETGFFKQFGVNERFIDNYIPHMRKKLYETGAEARTANELLNKLFENTPPKELVGFFKHVRRADELKNIILEDDPLVMILKYSEIGNRDLFIGDLYERARNLISSKGFDKHDAFQAARMAKYLDDIMGIPTGGERKLRALSDTVWKTFGMQEMEGKSLTDALMILGYSATMGFRPWLPIRNSFQIWTTLAPITGNTNVVKALNAIVNDKTGEVFNMLRAHGIITTGQPIAGGDQLFNTTLLLEKIGRGGLKWYKNSDEFTRAVGWLAANNRFMDAAERFTRMKLTPDQFTDLAGMNFLAPEMKKQIFSHINKGDWSTAADIFNTHIVDRAFFPYRSGMGPEAFRGVVGKLFGMFGTYPAFYVDNVMRTLRYAPLKDKVAFGLSFVGNSTLIYQSFRQLGIDSKSFQFWNPMFFAGGPYYQLMNDLLLAPTIITGNYKGRQAAAETLGLSTRDGKVTFHPQKSELFKMLLPGSFMARSVIESMEALGKGNYEEFFIKLTSAPLLKD